MKVTSVFTPIKNCVKRVTTSLTSKSVQAESKTVSGAQILGEQNRVLVMAPNQVRPPKTEFKSTKEMMEYAKARCMRSINAPKPFEYSIIMDGKNNRIIAEYRGSSKYCPMPNLDTLPINATDTIVIHSHPQSHPISRMDVNLLMRHNINQIIAVNKNGEFSMVAKRADYKPPKNSVKKNFEKKCADNAECCSYTNNEEDLKILTHLTLKECSKDMGLRYITNYGYLKPAKK